MAVSLLFLAHKHACAYISAVRICARAWFLSRACPAWLYSWHGSDELVLSFTKMLHQMSF